MLFSPSFLSLEIHHVIAWLILLFQGVIFSAEDSNHHKQNGNGARMGAFFMTGFFVKKYDSGAIRPLFYARHGIVLSWAATPSSASSHGQDRLHPQIHRQRWQQHRQRAVL